MKQIGTIGFFFVLVVGAVLLSQSMYIVTPKEQAILTRFKKAVGEPIDEEGIQFKLPFVQEVHKLPRQVLEWDGVSTSMLTKDKLLIQVDTYGRWKIVDALQFYRRLTEEKNADSKIGNILASETLKAIARHELVEVVRSTDHVTGGENRKPESLEPIEAGRGKIEEQIRIEAQKELTDLGIELLDLRFKRINYQDADVIHEIHNRMASERKQIAEQTRSEGDEEASLILGKMGRELKEIESDAYRRVQEIQGKADAEATGIYAHAYNQSPEAVEFYEFIRTMEVYKEVIAGDTTVILSTDSDLFQFLKGVNPELRKKLVSGEVSEELPLFLRDP